MRSREPFIEVQSPTQRAGAVAALVCLAAVVYLLTVGKTAVDFVPWHWARLLVYLIVPQALTFAVLHISGVCPAHGKTARICILFFISLLIFAGVCLSLVAIAVLAGVFSPLSRFHY